VTRLNDLGYLPGSIVAQPEISEMSAISLIILTACSEDSETNLGRFTVSEDFGNIRIEGSTEAQIACDALVLLELDLTASADFPDEGEDDFLSVSRLSVRNCSYPKTRKMQLRTILRTAFPMTSRSWSLSLSPSRPILMDRRKALSSRVSPQDARLGEGSRRFSLHTSEEDILMFVEANDGYRVTFDATGTPPPDDVVFGGSREYRARVRFR